VLLRNIERSEGLRLRIVGKGVIEYSRRTSLVRDADENLILIDVQPIALVDRPRLVESQHRVRGVDCDSVLPLRFDIKLAVLANNGRVVPADVSGRTGKYPITIRGAPNPPAFGTEYLTTSGTQAGAIRADDLEG